MYALTMENGLRHSVVSYYFIAYLKYIAMFFKYLLNMALMFRKAKLPIDSTNRHI